MQAPVHASAPASDPAGYPWLPLNTSAIVTADAVEPVLVDGSHWTTINAHLSAAGSAPMSERHAVLAIGSNRSLVALRRKYARVPGWVLPTLRVTVPGLDVGHAACVSRPGWIPWAPRVGTFGVRCSYEVAFLDGDTLAVLDATEPNYHRAALPPEHDVRLENGEVLVGVDLYCSRHGLIGGADGIAVPAGRQVQALELVAAALGRAVTHADLAADDGLREEAREAFAATAVSDGLAAAAVKAA
ncbi:hypothetical protein [Glycomyces sp. YM15]|uniref:hypothetical protein n=1 Tax=Glycomyces sp. YM15 TaxID=2800446 RepID=UPI001962EEFA|nr:hypothetical protein [Glycomyces sp. YM15]